MNKDWFVRIYRDGKEYTGDSNDHEFQVMMFPSGLTTPLLPDDEVVITEVVNGAEVERYRHRFADHARIEAEYFKDWQK